jgi:hypothetical protein
LTRDHIPPESFWGGSPPTNLITIPSCYRCNNRASLDDEYFGAVIAGRPDLGAAAALLRPSVARAFNNPKKSKKGRATPKQDVELIKQRYAQAREWAKHEE